MVKTRLTRIIFKNQNSPNLINQQLAQKLVLLSQLDSEQLVYLSTFLSHIVSTILKKLQVSKTQSNNKSQNQVQKISSNLKKFMSCLLQKLNEHYLLDKIPKLNFIFTQYEKVTSNKAQITWEKLTQKNTSYGLLKSKPRIQMILKSEVDEKREKLFSYSNFQERVKKVKKINDFIQDKIQLPDTNYVCCSKRFYRRWKISQAMNNIEWIGISKFRSKRNYEIVKRICALANIGGGVLLVGVDESEKRVQGLKISKQKNKKYKQKILEWESTIFPSQVTLNISYTPIYEDPLQQEIKKIDEEGQQYQDQDQEEEYQKNQDTNSLFILRILVKPKPIIKKAFMMKIEKTGFENHYQLYEKIHETKVIRKQRKDLYTSLHKYYYNRKKRNSHLNSVCSKQQQRIFQTEKNPSSIIESDFENQDIKEGYFDEKSNSKKYLTFLFRLQTLIIAGSTKIKSAYEIYKKIKMKYSQVQIFTPFSQLQDPNARQIKIISHQKNYEDIKPFIQQYRVELKFEKPTKFLKITSEYTDDHKEKFHKKFFKYFRNKPVYLREEKFNKKYKNSEIQFNDIEESIFAFIYFQKLSVRSTFN